MEPLAVVDIVHEFNEKFKYHLIHIITDEDSKMKANCRWIMRIISNIMYVIPWFWTSMIR